MTARPSPGPIDFAGSLSLTPLGVLHNITKRAYVVSFVFDFALSESDRSDQQSLRLLAEHSELDADVWAREWAGPNRSGP